MVYKAAAEAWKATAERTASDAAEAMAGKAAAEAGKAAAERAAAEAAVTAARAIADNEIAEAGRAADLAWIVAAQCALPDARSPRSRADRGRPTGEYKTHAPPSLRRFAFNAPRRADASLHVTHVMCDI
jgi:hypothetical protein